MCLILTVFAALKSLFHDESVFYLIIVRALELAHRMLRQQTNMVGRKLHLILWLLRLPLLVFCLHIRCAQGRIEKIGPGC